MPHVTEHVPTRNDMVMRVPSGGIGAELGVFEGEFSQVLWTHTNSQLLFLIDLWAGTVQSGDKDFKNVHAVHLPDAYAKLVRYYAECPEVVLLRGDTGQVLSLFPDSFYDWLYLDADHSYEGVKRDLQWSLRKLKPGGLLMGHAYNQKFFPGVVNAVNELNLSIDCVSDDVLPSFMITVPPDKERFYR